MISLNRFTARRINRFTSRVSSVVYQLTVMASFSDRPVPCHGRVPLASGPVANGILAPCTAVVLGRVRPPPAR